MGLPKPARTRPSPREGPSLREAVRQAGVGWFLLSLVLALALIFADARLAPLAALPWLAAVLLRYAGLRRDAPRALQGAVPEIRARPKMSVREELGKRGGHVTLNREVVRSKPELRIANFLYKRGVRYVYEPQLDGATPDFYLPDSNIVLEHWGMEHTRYIRRRAEKSAIYRSRGYLVVETEKLDVPRLERVLEARLLKADPLIFERAFK